MNDIIQQAVKTGNTRLSEYDSKRLISSYGVPVCREHLAETMDEAVKRAAELNYPVVLKGCGADLSHKTEMGLVKLGVSSEEKLVKSYEEITATGVEMDGVLVQEQVAGKREFVIGINRDVQFGPTVMFGLGGIYTEVLKDISFRIAPLAAADAEEMLDEIRSRELLDEFRGEPAVDRELLVQVLIGIGDLAMENDEVSEIDINPLIISGDRPVAVDALVILDS